MTYKRESEPEIVFIEEPEVGPRPIGLGPKAEKEVKQPLFSDEVFKDDLELIKLGEDDLDKLPI